MGKRIQLNVFGSRYCQTDLRAVLQYGNWELGTGHAGQPQTEVPVNLVPVNLLYESLQRGHPGGREVTVLEEDPATTIHGLL